MKLTVYPPQPERQSNNISFTDPALSAVPYYQDPNDISTERKHLSVPGALHRQAHL